MYFLRQLTPTTVSHKPSKVADTQAVNAEQSDPVWVSVGAFTCAIFIHSE